MDEVGGRRRGRGWRWGTAAPIIIVLIAAFSSPIKGQYYRPGFGPVPIAPSSSVPTSKPRLEHKDPPPPGVVVVWGIVQDVQGQKYHLKDSARVESAEMLLEADEIDYDGESGAGEARGHVHLTNFTSGEQLWADRADFNFTDKTGTFYQVKGTTWAKIDPRPGVLYSDKPYRFSGSWAEKFADRYVLYEGTLTNCDTDPAWWALSAPKFDIEPNHRALAYKGWMKIRKVPVLYAPVLYKSLEENPRKSGFLTPSVGTSSRRGFMVGGAYYWAINRSYDATYRLQYFTMRGPAHTFDFRGKPTQNSSFDAYAYGVNDKGLELPDGTRRYEGGYLLTVSGQTALPAGWSARGTYNYLSSFLFRQSFTESFNEAVFSEVNSTVYATRNWSSYHLNVVMTGHTNFMSTMPDDKIDIRKLPQVEFASRYRELIRGDILQVWVSWDASAGLLRRNQPLFQTRKFVDRLDAEPRLMTALRWKEFNLVPWVSVRETHYGSSVQNGDVTGADLNRFSQEYGADLILPTLVKVFNGPKWMGGRMKHSIEPRAQVRLVRGVGDFNSIIRFDDVDLVANTSEVEYSLTNRLWAKNRDGVVWDWMTWDVRQRRYFDPTFGGAVRPGYRNVFASTADLTAYAFTDQARHYSPVVNSLRVAPRPGFGFEWRADYDPLRGKVTNTIAAADVRKDQYFLSVGHSRIACVPLGSNASSDQPVPGNCVNAPPGTVLSPVSNQLRFLGGIGRENRRGWNAGFLAIYDFATGVMQYANTQVTYNTACCAFSGQYRRFGIGTRNENQFRVAFVVANIGSFGTLKRNERLF